MFDDSSMSSGTSPHSYLESPHSSPSQQVPILANHISELSCADDDMASSDRPMLKILEEPSHHFRFRYKSEMVGTHGCIVGQSSASNRAKTFPSVQLLQYRHRAVIRCRLVQADSEEPHPHQLFEDEDDSDVCAEVNPDKGYVVSFHGMGIIHTAKKEVGQLLYKQISEKLNKKFNARELRSHCENIAKSINLNIVRLKFSAHHIDTDEEICSPVFSHAIHNMKSAATNEMKICRMDRASGRARGLEDVYMLTEKINKKNIEIHFIELDHKGDTAWTAKGRFHQSEVHHQYAIVFRTPPYRDPEITSDVKVYVELVRPSDNRRSDRMEFTYIADEVYKQRKKRKPNSLSSIGSSCGSGSIKSLSDVPASVLTVNKVNGVSHHAHAHAHAHISILPQIHAVRSVQNDANLQQALFEDLTEQPGCLPSPLPSPMLGKGAMPEPPTVASLLNSGDVNHLSPDFENLLKDYSIRDEDVRRFETTNFSDYFKFLEQDHVVSGDEVMDTFDSKQFLQFNLKPDSGWIKDPEAASTSSQDTHSFSLQTDNKKEKANEDYTAFYTMQAGMEVKQLVKELCEMIRTKTQQKKPIVRAKLEQLFQLRLSNGDTFLHLTICNNILPSMEYIVKLIDSLKMTHLLNETNQRGQTILHLAIINDLRDYIPFLVAKGCNPMCGDVEGNHAIHYAVKCGSCLAPLLSAIRANPTLECDLNACNKNKQTALHLAAYHRSPHSATLLLQHQASYSTRDDSGRTPLHIAACDADLPLVRALLEFIPASDVDAVDSRGYTALQIICGSQLTKSTAEAVDLLLAKGANPEASEEDTETAWKMARDKPEIRELMKTYVPSYIMLEAEVKSEPEDDFESADEGESDVGLEALSAYIRQVASILDRSGGWRELAARLHCDAMNNWFQGTPSPTTTLLMQVKECQEDVTSHSLAKILTHLGEYEAAEVILKYVDV